MSDHFEYDVFLSHNKADKPQVKQLAERLKAAGMRVWFDDWVIKPGDDIYLAVEHGLEVTRVQLLCLSQAALDSDWVKLERSTALFRDPTNKGRRFIPLLLDDCDLPDTLQRYKYLDFRKATDAAFEVILATCQPEKSSVPKENTQIHSDRLPNVKGKFFGREAEIQILNDAWAGNDTRIIQFIAPGGTGKTKLLRHWLDQTDNIEVLIAWSFYSQGTSEDKQISATPFFSHAFDKLGSTRDLSSFNTEEDKGEHLADLLRQHRAVLVLDGLEPLQHASKGMRGELKDRAVRQLLKSLAGQNSGLCIITTRIAVHELSDREHVHSHDLKNLTPADGVELLQSLKVKGQTQELEKAVMEYGCHALALSLLGNLLRKRHYGDILKRDTLKELVQPDGERESRHAFKVMQAYKEWFSNEPELAPELALLKLLGLFDHPIEREVLQILWNEQIPNLTAGISADNWQEAIAALREEHHLLSQHENTDVKLDDQLDCHPLVREYFGRQLREKQPDTWQQAHARLYDYYKALPEKELPDTLEEMQPLFSAVAHGCAAELYQQVRGEVYYPRVCRWKKSYLIKKLGAYNDDLAIAAHFFSTPWHTPAANLTEADQAAVLNRAGFDLNAQGRLREALELTQTAVGIHIKLKNWKEVAINTGNLSGTQLALGNVAAAVASSLHSVYYADQSRVMLQRATGWATYADALHQAGGETTQTLKLFMAAEQIQQEAEPELLYLYSLRGFKYCDLLLAQGNVAAVLKQAEHALKISRKHSWLQAIALDKLTLGRAHYQQSNFPQATDWLNQAVDDLRIGAWRKFLLNGLLARAALYRDTHNPNHDFSRACKDLQEVFDIAEPSGMRLHLTDYHLEMARLLIAEQENPSPTPVEKSDSAELSLHEHVAKAAKLIEETGYKRRLPELQELQKQLAL